MEKIELENLGSLITIKGTDQCLGFLMEFQGRGIFDPAWGNVSHLGVTPEIAKAHNTALEEALIKGLDENCKVGQWGTFYLTEKDGSHQVTSFGGTVVSTDVVVEKTKRKNSYGGFWLKVTFRRNGRVFVGKNNGDDQLLNFKRTA